MTLFPCTATTPIDDTTSKSGLCVYEFTVKDNTYVHYTDHSPQTAIGRLVNDKLLSGNNSVSLLLILFLFLQCKFVFARHVPDSIKDSIF